MISSQTNAEFNPCSYEELHTLCHTSLQILSDYYDFTYLPPITQFILPKSDTLCCSNVLFEETDNDVYIGVQFSHQIFDDIQEVKNTTKPGHIPINTAAVIAEEISHLKFILDAVENNKKISLIDIEMFGEIDRFLCLMHWNDKSTKLRIMHNWRSLHDICDCMFSGKRFLNQNLHLYIEAERRAFYHLKNAFQNIWDNTLCDFSSVHFAAKLYLKKLRQNF